MPTGTEDAQYRVYQKEIDRLREENAALRASVPAPVVDREAVMDALNSAGVDLYPQQKRKIADAILALLPAGTGDAEGEK